MFLGLLFLFLVPISLCAMEEDSSRRNSRDAESGELAHGSLYPMRQLTYDDSEPVSREEPATRCGYVLYENWKDDWNWMWGTVDSKKSCCGQVFEKSFIALVGCTIGPPSPCFPDACVRPVLSVCCEKSIEKRSQDFSLRLAFLRVTGCLVLGCFVF